MFSRFLRLTTEEKMIQSTARAFAKKELSPIIVQANRTDTFHDDLYPKMGSAGLLGITIPEKYGGGGLHKNAYGIVAREIEYVDSAYRSAMSVQSSLVMGPIHDFGNERQRNEFLPKLATGEYVGAFGLTEPNHGSDPGSMETTVTKEGDSYFITGSKTWITNAPIADIFVIWGKYEGQVHGFIVRRDENDDPEVLDTPTIENKCGLRASKTGMIHMNRARAEMLPNVSGLKGPFTCLNNARFGISWGALGAAEACMDMTLEYTNQREQFGKSLSSFQLIQKKFADMYTEIALGLNLCYSMGDKLDPVTISLLKRNNCGKALDIARTCRDMMGANGISDEYHVMRHMNNLEVVNTYEGTHDIHALIIGRYLTGGRGAFD